MKLTCAHADTCLPDYWGGHHLPDDLIDREGNPVRPVLSTDEIASGVVCDDCFRPLVEN